MLGQNETKITKSRHITSQRNMEFELFKLVAVKREKNSAKHG